MDFQEIFSIV